MGVDIFEVKSAWGETPHEAVFLWKVKGFAGPLTCTISPGDGSQPITLNPCPAQNMNGLLSAQHSYTKPGVYKPSFVIRDDQENVLHESTTVYANQLKFEPNVVFPERLPGLTKLDRTDGVVTLTFASGTSVPAIKPGAILWSQSHGGFLLRVTAATASGSSLRLTTSDASLIEAVRNGFIGARNVVPSTDGARCLDADGCPGSVVTPMSGTSAAKRTLEGGTDIKQTALNISASGGEAGIKVERTLSLGSGGKELVLSVFGGLSVDKFVLRIEEGMVTQFELDVAPTFSVDANLTFASVSKDWSLGNFRVGAITVGPVLIIPTISPVVTLSASLDSGFIFSQSLRAPWSVWLDTAAGRLKMSGSAHADSSGSLPPSTLAFTATGATGSVKVQPRMVFSVLGIGGPFVSPTLGADLTAAVVVGSSPGLCLTAWGTVGVDVGLALTLPNIPPDKSSVSTTLAEYNQEIAKVCAPGADAGVDARRDAGADRRDAARDTRGDSPPSYQCSVDYQCMTAPPPPGEWSSCVSSKPCDYAGTKSRNVFKYRCNGSTHQCELQTEREEQPCGRTGVDGTSCGTTVDTGWGACVYPDACATRGMKTRQVTTFTCGANVCRSSTSNDYEPCGGRTTEGNSCGTDRTCKAGVCTSSFECVVDYDCKTAPPEPGAWSSCTPDQTCAYTGTQSRNTYRYRCNSSNHRCELQTDREERQCPRSGVDGTSCGTTTETAWGACTYPDTCATHGTKTRQVTTYTCGAGLCRSNTSNDYDPCGGRSTEGNSCGTNKACVSGECKCKTITCGSVCCPAGSAWCGGANGATCCSETSGSPGCAI